jgi:ribosomal protein S18 acetylase RimI-like enzyme
MYVTYLLKQLFYRTTESLNTFREKGMRAGLMELARTGARIFYRRESYMILATVLSECETTAEPVPGLVIHQIKSLEDIACLRLVADSADIARFHKLFKAGSIGFVASEHGRAVGYGWISQEVNPDVNRVQAALHLRPGDAYVHDLFTSPMHRSKGIGKALVTHRLQFLQERGYSRAVEGISKDNMPALKIYGTIGYESIGEISHTRILFWDHFKCKCTKNHERGSMCVD